SNFQGDVQFGIFDTTDSVGIDDATLVLSPKDFTPIGGTPGQIAHSGASSYGFDDNGDFFITFVTPDHVGGGPGHAASFALHLQGAFNTDYTIEVTQNQAQTGTITQAPQNFFLETRGGTLDWLEAGGVATKLLPFASSVLGFNGTIGGQTMDQY